MASRNEKRGRDEPQPNPAPAPAHLCGGLGPGLLLETLFGLQDLGQTLLAEVQLGGQLVAGASARAGFLLAATSPLLGAAVLALPMLANAMRTVRQRRRAAA